MATRSATRTAAPLVLVLVTLAAGCGSEQRNVAGRQQAAHASVTAGAAARVAPASTRSASETRAERRAARDARRTESAARAVRAYYRAIARGELTLAWQRHSPALNAGLGSYDTWAAGYATTTSVRPEVLSALPAPGPTVEIELRLRASDIDACGETVRQVFRARVVARREHGRWVFDAMEARRTYGHAPTSDMADCRPVLDAPDDYGDVPEEDSGSGSGCHPSYEGYCVPEEGYDVDCGEIAATDLTVVGPDEYGLDADSDGVACES